MFLGDATEGRVRAWGDQRRNDRTRGTTVLPDGSIWSRYRGASGDGDDIIEMGDHAETINPVKAYANGGNDKVFGGVGVD